MTRYTRYFASLIGLAAIGACAWAQTEREGYESAGYKVIESDGAIEIREYPDLMLAATDSKSDATDRDGSFMRLFQYISGANEAEQKIAMTTPVFMEGELGQSSGSMGFVMPAEVAAQGPPDPNNDQVKLRKRKGGRFAVIRFSGRLDAELAKKQEAKLRQWMKSRELQAEPSAEAAGYDPPFTPPQQRRNEILIRVKSDAAADGDADVKAKTEAEE
ncbi:SOUL family heme-binding protein [Roseimaritima sediminicola]|uniref:SOUL family heme-binding protein n=1 Tax=Roseimaritima sediminicola TaxID=2662066 RepID=UPI0012984C7C|nr:heme-binding protein [Roseimaritima sediminicola]